MGKSLYEIHTSYVEELKKRGEKIIHCPAREPAVAICVLGYDKTKGYETAGYIYRNEDDGPCGEFELHQDHLTGVHQVKWADIGLCDARCMYKANDKRLTDANKEQAEKLTENKLMSSDFIILGQQRDKLAEALKEIRKAVASVNLFSSEAEQHKQMDKALREISEILEGIL